MKRPLQGFSLIELLVAVGLSAVLLGGFFSIANLSRTTYQSIDRKSKLHNAGNFALQRLAEDIRAAGWRYCSRGARVHSTLRHSDQPLWDFSKDVIGFEGSGVANWPPAVDTTFPAPKNGTDALILHIPAATAEFLKLVVSMRSANDTLQVSGNGPSASFARDNIVAVQNCAASTVFQITDVAQNQLLHRSTDTLPGNSSENLEYAFPSGSVIVPMHAITYFVAASNSGAGSSLWRRVNNAPAQELVAGVLDLQISYGIDNSGDNRVHSYVSATEVSDWDRVLSVRVTLSIQPTEPATSDESRTRPETFVSTTTLRNRVS